MKCKICASDSHKIFEKTILQKYNTAYYQCSNCSFVQTDEPHWLKEAYESAITSLDIGLAGRNITLRGEIKEIIDSCFPETSIYLDYAGGYGMFVRLMRDIGYDFFRQDDYCENIFANYFDIKDIKTSKFDIVTAFEVLEHFNNPLEEIAKVFEYADTVIFSTELLPKSSSKIENWWYITEETGQHIAFYSDKAMQLIAKKFNKNYYRRNHNIHVFTSKTLQQPQIDFAFRKRHKKILGYKIEKINQAIQRESLTQVDYEYIKSILNK